MIRRALIYVAGVVCLSLVVLQLLTFLGGYAWGFTHEVWRTTPLAGRHANTGAVMDEGKLFLFFEREQHPLPPRGTKWWTDLDEWQTAGSPPQFTVTSYRQAHWWIVLGTGYRLVERQPNSSYAGRYHLIVVHPLVLLLICGVVIFVATRTLLFELRRQNRMETLRCGECGYDLRGGHERCPECGTLVDRGTPAAAVTGSS